MKIVQNNIPLEELKQMAQSKFGDLVKAVVDVEKGIMAVDADLHADEESLLIENGSKQENLWGINIYPEVADPEKRIEFDSVINIRPHLDNRTRSVDSEEVRRKIIDITSENWRKYFDAFGHAARINS